jgi:uncharacterized membrane protein YsdA (DUF1294 family)/cold shock CspA family protein
MRFDGRLKTWNDDRGFGFVEPLQGGDEVFVHIKAFANLRGRPAVGQLLSFEVELGPQGKKRATRVELPRPAHTRSARSRDEYHPAAWGTATLFAIGGLLLLYGVLAVVWKAPAIIAAVYAGVSVATFGAYALDKSAAERGAWRTPEQTLHLLALAGGWPGALVAQQVLRHKTTKAAFRATFWITVVLNVIGLVVLCSPVGRRLWAA